MALFKNNQNTQQISQRALYEGKYNSARANLLAVILFTLVNIVLVLTNSNRYFLFSAFIPYIIAGVGMEICGKLPAEYYAEYGSMEPFFDNTVFAVMIGIAALFIVIYLLCWLLSKKYKVAWLVVAMVLFALDTVSMLLLSGDLSDSVIDIVFHVWVIYYLISGISAYKKLKDLPEEEEQVMDAAEAAEVPEIPAAENNSPEF